jgi:hypothetical protein
MKYLAIVRANKSYEMVELKRGSRPSNYVCAAPPGLTIEDMKYITVIERPRQNPELVIDWKSKLNKSELQEVIEVKTEWNNQSLLGRIKSSVLK